METRDLQRLIQIYENEKESICEQDHEQNFKNGFCAAVNDFIKDLKELIDKNKIYDLGEDFPIEEGNN